MIEQDKKLPHFELTGNILIVEQTVIMELKCCENLGKEHQAQLFNYLKVSQLPIGLLVNFRRGKLEWKRLQSNQECIVDMETVEEPVSF
jgi:GxxExxY protein